MPLRLTVILVLCGAGLAHAADDDPPRVIDLTDAGGWLPYRFEIVMSVDNPTHFQRGWVTTRHLEDLDGDGVDDVVRTGDYGIYLAYTRPLGDIIPWQSNLPVAFSGRYPCASVDGVWDVDGDGAREVVVRAWTEDKSAWLIRLVDLASGATERDLRIPGGPDNRPDGSWDGNYRVIGPLSVPAGAGERPALLVGAESGLDLEPRGVLAVDAVTGDVLWRYATGPKPTIETLRIVDLDGDGEPGILFLGAGVNNLAGRPVNGVSDDRAMIFVLNRDGTLRWLRELGPAPASGLLETLDLDGDGRLEIAVVAPVPEAGGLALAIVDADNRLSSWTALQEMPGGFAVAQLADGSFGAYLSYPDRVVQKYRLSGAGVTLLAEAVLGAQTSLALVADLVDEPGVEVVVGLGSGVAWLLDEDLSPLARLTDNNFRFYGPVAAVIVAPDGSRRLVNRGAVNSHRGVFAFLAVPRPFPWWLVVPAVSLAGGGLLARRRRHKPHSVATKRELRIQLLGRLQLSGHGAIGALSSLRRFIWHLDTVMQGFAADVRVTRRLTELSRDTLDVGLPNLDSVLEIAAIVELDTDEVQRARSLVQDLRRTLTGLTAAGFGAGELRAGTNELQEVAAEAERSFQRLRRVLEQQFLADPRAVLTRSLAAHAGTVEELGVTVEVAAAEAPPCRIDEEELAFILDNLIENALRAMRQSPERRLAVNWQAAGPNLLVTVADTGCGIAPDAREAVLSPGYSRREGGGLGLPRSRELLRKYGGDLNVKESAPGRGTVMALLLPLGAAARDDLDSRSRAD